MEKDPFKESEPDKGHKGFAWSTAIGLQAVDGLKPSKYLIETAIQNIEGKITIKEVQSLIDSYYEERPVHLFYDERTEEADIIESVSGQGKGKVKIPSANILFAELIAPSFNV